MNSGIDPTGGGDSEPPPPNPGQQRSLDRFTRKLPKGHGPVIIEVLPGGGRAFVSDVPGRIAGSKAIYRKEVDDLGQTTGYTKTTIGPSGNMIHIKDKFPGGGAVTGDTQGD